MTIASTTPLPESGPPVHAARVSTAVLLSPAGVNDVATLARQQLPGAVPAAALVPAYTATIVSKPLPPKPPSSALATQMLAQDETLAPPDLAMFTPPAPPVAPPPADDFLATLRLARGGTQSTEPTPKQAVAAPPPATEASTRTGLAATIAPTLAPPHARAAQAYRLTSTLLSLKKG